MTATGTTTTETPTTETLTSPPPVHRPRGALTAAGFAVVAAIAITPWLLTTSSQTEADPVTPISAAALPQQTAQVPGQVAAVSDADSVERPAGYAQFCQNSPSLCMPAASTLPATAYAQFARTAPVCAFRRRPNHRRLTFSSARTAPSCARNPTNPVSSTASSVGGH
jgi:hypothetical protein